MSITQRIIFSHIVAIIITSALMPYALYLLLQSAADDLQHRSLRENAEVIAHYLVAKPDGRLELSLPHKLEALFSEAYGRYAYSVLDGDGNTLFSSLANGAPLYARDTRSRNAVFLAHQRGKVLLTGASIPFRAGGHDVWVQISEDMDHRDVLIDDIVREFFARVGWITIPILLFLLAIDVTIFRRALKPLLIASELAAKIGPERTDVRLPLETIPSEIKPLVGTINKALDRLDQGFQVQRDFTADAAHELRTPLSILQARVDTMQDKGAVKDLSLDIARMRRVISQLLDIAELEAFAVKPSETACLKAVCMEVAEFVAPIAIAEGKQILLDAPDDPVPVRGNAEVIFRALRNIVDNAIAHTPAGTSVSITLGADGSVTVTDEGCGISEYDMDKIFQRFWRKDRRRRSGSGLGLPIVKRIMDAHGGKIKCENRPGGGLSFIIEFHRLPASN